MLNYRGVKKLFRKLEQIHKTPKGSWAQGASSQVSLPFIDVETSVHKLMQPVCRAGKEAPLNSMEDLVSGDTLAPQGALTSWRTRNIGSCVWRETVGSNPGFTTCRSLTWDMLAGLSLTQLSHPTRG